MGEDHENILCNSFSSGLSQSCMPCNSWAIQLQALVSATRKMPEAITPFCEGLPEITHAGAERS